MRRKILYATIGLCFAFMWLLFMALPEFPTYDFIIRSASFIIAVVIVLLQIWKFKVET